MMIFEAWGAKCRPGQIALLSGGHPLSVLAYILRTLQRPTLFLADRPFAALAEAELDRVTLEFADVRMTRGLAMDLATALDERGEDPIVLSSPVIENDLAFERKRVGNQISILAGYPLPPVLVDGHVVWRLTETLNEAARRRIAPLIVHDARKLLDARRLPGAIKVEMGASFAGSEARASRDTLQVSLQHIRSHADFLARTDMALLRQMHRFLRGPGAAPIVEYWRGNLGRLDAVADAAEVQSAALRALDELALETPERDSGPPLSLIQAPVAYQDEAPPPLPGPAAPHALLTAPNAAGVAQASRWTRGSPASDGPLVAPDAGDAIATAVANALAGAQAAHDRVKAAAVAEALADAEAAAGEAQARAIAGALAEARVEADREIAASVSKARMEAETAAGGARAAAIEAAVARTRGECEHEKASAVSVAIAETEAATRAAANEELARALAEAHAAGEDAKAAAVASALDQAAAQAQHQQQAAVDQAIAQTQAAAAKSEADAIERVLEQAKAVAGLEKDAAVTETAQRLQAEAREAEAEAVRRALSDAHAAAELAQQEAITSAVARAEAAAAQAHTGALDAALAAAATQAATARTDAIAAALAEASTAAALVRDTAIAAARAEEQAAARERQQRAIEAALAEAHAAAEVAQSRAIADALAEARREADVARERAVTEALAAAEAAAAQARADADAAASAEIARRHSRLAGIRLADIETQMTPLPGPQSDHQAAANLAGVRALVRPLNQASSQAGNGVEYARQRWTLDDQVRAALARIDLQGQRQNGVVEVEFSIAGSGGAREARVTKSSGHAELDATALTLIEKARLPALPSELTPGPAATYSALLHFV